MCEDGVTISVLPAIGIDALLTPTASLALADSGVPINAMILPIAQVIWEHMDGSSNLSRFDLAGSPRLDNLLRHTYF